MSVIKRLKNNNQYQLNVVDMLEAIIPVKKTKYVELMLRLMKNTIDLNHHTENIKSELCDAYGIPKESLDGMNTMSLILYYNFLNQMFNSSDIKMIQKFCDYNERGVISNKDISTYKTFDEIMTSIGLAELKEIEKELETQVIKIFEDDEWLVVKPLTFHASKKYGSSTKWCTTMEHEPSYFLDYSKNGILIYSLNKITGFKVATHYHLKTKHLTFWDQPDKQIDSMRCGLPKFILEKIEDDITICVRPNNFYLSASDKKAQDRLLSNMKMSSQEIDRDGPRPLRGAVIDRGDVPMSLPIPEGFGLEEPMDTEMDEREDIIEREYQRITNERRARLIEMSEEEGLEIDDLEDEEEGDERPTISMFDYIPDRRTATRGALVPLGAMIREIDESVVPRNESRGGQMWISPRMDERMSEERVQRNTNEPQGMGDR